MECYQTFLKSQLFTRQSPNLKKLGFDFDNQNTLQEYNKIQQLLVSKYYIEGESMLTIMKEFNIPSSRTMDILFRHFGIGSRSFSDATKNAIMCDRHPCEAPSFPNIKQSWHTDWKGDKHFLRSSYELDFAQKLDETKIQYHVESMRIMYYSTKQKMWKIAIPDFYLPSTNCIVEIKGSYWYDQQDILDRKKAFEDLGYQFRLILDKEELCLNG